MGLRQTHASLLQRGGTQGKLWPSVLLDIGLVCLALGVIWGGIFLHLAEQRREIAERAARSSMNLARAAAADIGRTIVCIDEAALFLRASYAASPRDFDIAAWVRRFADPTMPVLEYGIVDPYGRLVRSTIGAHALPLDLSDRAYVQTQLETPDDVLRISEPVRGRLTGRWVIQYTRKIVGSDGADLGLVVLSVDPRRLASLYDELDMGRGSVGLVGLDGIVRARTPAGEAMIGRSVAGSELLAQALSHVGGTVVTRSQLDGAERVMSFRRVTGYPLFVTVGFDERDIFADFQRYRRQYLVAGTGLSLLALSAGLLLLLSRRSLLASRRDLAAAIENIGQGLVMLGPRGRVVVANRRAVELLGDVPGRQTGQLASGQHEELRPGGRLLDVRTQGLADGGAVRTYTDITERRETERRIRHLAGHDALTGLANRTLLDELLAQAIVDAGRRGGLVAVLLLDLDRFRAVNAGFGHATGDRVLGEVAARLRAAVGSSDFAARTGGDEFVVVLRDLPSGDALPGRARHLLEALAEPIQVGFQRVFVRASLGAALFPLHGASGTELLHNAQAALDRTRADGRRLLVFEPEMEVALARRRMVERDLRAAIGTAAIALHYQPRVRLADGVVTCLEALLRWTHPVHEAVEPAAFIPIAEESGLIHPLGAWALKAACEEARKWPAGICVAVNVSTSQVRSGELPRLVARVLAETGLPATRLELEVTESLLMEDAEQARVSLVALREMGVSLALDDFGTGYSSLSYLRAFPFNEIKIDQSFVRALDADRGALAIVQAIIAMGRGLDLSVTAEGVETEQQLRVLRALGCGAAQGFLLGRAEPPEEIPAMLARMAATIGS